MSSEFKFRALTSEDWKEITGENFIFAEGLKLKDTEELKDTEKDGTYTSESLDSGIPGCSWHRIVIDAEVPENSTISIAFNTSEIEDVEFFSNSKPIVFTKAKDALIQAPPGRYLRLQVGLHREGKESPVLRQVKVYYERLSYLRYLPAIYQDNSESKEFLERFLSIFESSMYDSEELISSVPMFFDPKAAPKEFYRWLADWLSLDLYDLLEEDKKREFILRAVEFYKKKGTVSGLVDLVFFLTGKECRIKEYRNNVFRSWGSKGENECTKFYERTSKTVKGIDKSHSDTSCLPGNRGKYYDEMHYVAGTSSEKSGQTISYFTNSIGIFVSFPLGDKLQIERHQLRKMIDSFLPVFVRADITYVEASLEESYPLSRVEEEYSDEVIIPLEEGSDVQYVEGVYDDKVEDWICFYTYCRTDCPNLPSEGYGHTYSEKEPKYKNIRTIHRNIGSMHNNMSFTLSI